MSTLNRSILIPADSEFIYKIFQFQVNFLLNNTCSATTHVMHTNKFESVLMCFVSRAHANNQKCWFPHFAVLNVIKTKKYSKCFCLQHYSCFIALVLAGSLKLRSEKRSLASFRVLGWSSFSLQSGNTFNSTEYFILNFHLDVLRLSVRYKHCQW